MPPARTGPSAKDTAHLRNKDSFAPAAPQKELTSTDIEFMNRMTNDVDKRRRDTFINDLKQHPYFKPSMLEPPKQGFKEVSLTDGPILKTHAKNQTGLETKRPYQWGPLGGWY